MWFIRKTDGFLRSKGILTCSYIFSWKFPKNTRQFAIMNKLLELCFSFYCVLTKSGLTKEKPLNSSCAIVLMIEGSVGVKTGSSLVKSWSKLLTSRRFFWNKLINLILLFKNSRFWVWMAVSLCGLPMHPSRFLWRMDALEWHLHYLEIVHSPNVSTGSLS